MHTSERLLYLLLSIIGYFILCFLILGILGNYFNQPHAVLLVNLSKIMLLVIIWFYIKLMHEKINGIKWEEYFSFKWIDIPKFLLGTTVPIILTLLSLAILKAMNPGVDIFFLVTNFTAKHIGNSFLISYSEELFFRCLIFLSLLRIMKGVLLPAVISSALFALVHLVGIPEAARIVTVINIFIGGLVLCYIYHLTNSIWTSIGFHTLNNALSTVIDYPKLFQEWASTTSLIIYTGLLLILLVACIVADVKMNRINAVTGITPPLADKTPSEKL